MTNVVTRFAPSPSGLLHAGAYRTAVFAYLVARKAGGKFIVRIEDTDKERSKKEYEENIIESLKWLSLDYDELYRQSERALEHKKALLKLIAEGHAYLSKEEPAKEERTNGEGEKDKPKRQEVIRFRNPNVVVTFTDIIHGPISTDTTDLGDFVLARSMEEPLFHLAVVVDDAAQGITHVIRGDDHISNTPRQMLIGRALGLPIPHYAHLPIVLGADRSKLSKRRGAKAITEYRDRGFVPEAVLNYVALLGWHPADSDEEVFALPELVKRFDLSRVQKGGALFDEEKLLWFNREHLRRLKDVEYERRLVEYMRSRGATGAVPRGALPLLRERARTLKEAHEMLTGELSFLSARPAFDPALLVWKGETAESTRTHLRAIINLLHETTDVENEKWGSEYVRAKVFPYAEKEGKGSVLWPMRVALSGRERSPDPFTIAALLGHEETLLRLRFALERIAG